VEQRLQDENAAMRCVICKQGEVEPGTATVTLRRGECILIFRDVPAEVCDSCAEYYLSEEVTERLLQRVETAIQNGAELEILRVAPPLRIGSLWESRDIMEWRYALACYWNQVKPENLQLERFMSKVSPEYVKSLRADSWYAFLHDKYFPWKFTRPWLKTNTLHLEKYKTPGRLDELLSIKEGLFAFDPSDIQEGLNAAQMVKGLGPPGASGLLAIMFPKWFGTADQFVVKSLARVESLPESERNQVLQMDPKNLTTANAVLVIDIMRRKASELNASPLSKADEWTPRKIDMILWSNRN
jgi:YgiT-type zinc finger domain-containing protein